MGWKCREPQYRNFFLKNAIKQVKSLNPTNVVLCDGNAWLRRHFTGSIPVDVCVKRVLETFIGINPKFIALFFDKRALVPEERKQVWTVRSSKVMETRITQEQFNEMQNSQKLTTNVTWQQLFAFSDTKKLAFGMIINAIKWHAVKTHQAKIQWIVSGLDHEGIWQYPFDAPVNPIVHSLQLYKYGEAEAQVVMAVRQLVCEAYNSKTVTPNITVFTIDTDIALQLCNVWSVKVTIVWAKVWLEGNIVYRTLKKSTPKSKLHWEIIEGNVAYGSQSKQRLAWSLFCMLCAGGVDYCNGLGSFGWHIPVIAKSWLNCSGWNDIIHYDAASYEYTFNTSNFFRLLRLTRKGIRKDTPTKNGGSKPFVDELNSILFCFQYYLWQEATRSEPYAGPRTQKLLSYPDVMTVSGFIFQKLPSIRLIDYNPCTLDLQGNGHTSDSGYYLA